MGLALVELVMETEEKFDLDIADEEAVKIRTVGELYDYVWGRVKDRGLAVCRTSRCFHRLRKSLQSRFAVPRDRIRPATLMEVLIPGDDLPAEWALLAYSSALELPKLRSRWAVTPRGRLRRIPETCRTLEGLVRTLIPLNHGRLSSGLCPWTEGECKEALRGIIARILEVHPDRVVPRASFINDLGAD